MNSLSKESCRGAFLPIAQLSNVWIGRFIGARLLYFDVIIIFGEIHSNQNCFTAIFPTLPKIGVPIFINDPISVWSRPELPGFRPLETPGRVRPLQKFRIRPYHFLVQFWLLWLQISKISILNPGPGFWRLLARIFGPKRYLLSFPSRVNRPVFCPVPCTPG